MFNLLPYNLKTEIRKEYLLRYLIVVGALIVFMQASILTFMFPSWLISVFKERDVKSQVETIANHQNYSEKEDILSSIEKMNRKVNLLNTSLVYVPVIPELSSIIYGKRQNIHITQFSYNYDGNSASMIVGGVADTREGLVTFAKDLKSSGNFNSVELPVSNLTKEENILFSISLTKSDQKE